MIKRLLYIRAHPGDVAFFINDNITQTSVALLQTYAVIVFFTYAHELSDAVSGCNSHNALSLNKNQTESYILSGYNSKHFEKLVSR